MGWFSKDSCLNWSIWLWHTRESRNGIDPSGLESSVVNWILGSILLMCWKNSSLLAELKMTQVSSTYLFHILGGLLGVWMAFTSKSSMKRLATMGLMGDPIAASSSCHTSGMRCCQDHQNYILNNANNIRHGGTPKPTNIYRFLTPNQYKGSITSEPTINRFHNIWT